MFRRATTLTGSFILCLFMLLATIGCDGNSPTSNNLDSVAYSQRMTDHQNSSSDANFNNEMNNRENDTRRYEYSNRNKYGKDNPHTNRNHDKPKNLNYPHHDDDPQIITTVTFEDIIICILNML